MYHYSHDEELSCHLEQREKMQAVKTRDGGFLREAAQYDGAFPLAWLREDESVSSAGDGSGACLLHGEGHGPIRLDVGDWLVRDSDGWPRGMDTEFFEANYEFIEVTA